MNAIVTGASRGIGKAIAEKLASLGYDLFLNARDSDRLNKATEELRKKFPSIRIQSLALDISIKENAIRFGKCCLESAIPDVLVNNAGAYTPGHLIDEEDGKMEQMMNVNFYSAYHLTRSIIAPMIKSGKGHIFNICSIASLDAYAGGASYSVSKYALYGFSKNLRHELQDNGIGVTAIHPGAVMTDTWGDFDNSKGRIMLPDDIAAAVAACLSLSPQAVMEDIVIRPQRGDL
jgi:short-subunit dehydrogenase